MIEVRVDKQTVARAIKLLSSENGKTAPIVVKLSGHVQTNDRLAIREMGRQIAVAEGVKPAEEEGNEEDAADGDAEVGYRALSRVLS